MYRDTYPHIRGYAAVADFVNEIEQSDELIEPVLSQCEITVHNSSHITMKYREQDIFLGFMKEPFLEGLGLPQKFFDKTCPQSLRPIILNGLAQNVSAPFEGVLRPTSTELLSSFGLWSSHSTLPLPEKTAVRFAKEKRINWSYRARRSRQWSFSFNAETFYRELSYNRLVRDPIALAIPEHNHIVGCIFLDGSLATNPAALRADIAVSSSINVTSTDNILYPVIALRFHRLGNHPLRIVPGLLTLPANYELNTLVEQGRMPVEGVTDTASWLRSTTGFMPTLFTPDGRLPISFTAERHRPGPYGFTDTNYYTRSYSNTFRCRLAHQVSTVFQEAQAMLVQTTISDNTEVTNIHEAVNQIIGEVEEAKEIAPNIAETLLAETSGNSLSKLVLAQRVIQMASELPAFTRRKDELQKHVNEYLQLRTSLSSITDTLMDPGFADTLLTDDEEMTEEEDMEEGE